MRKPENAPSIYEIIKSRKILEVVGDQKAEVNQLLERIQKEYLPWEKIKHLPAPANFVAQDIWAFTKLKRWSGRQGLGFGDYTFHYCTTPYIQMALHEFDMQYGGRLGASNPLQQDDKQQYLISSIMEEAIASSQIEGAVTTRLAAKEMLKKNRPPRNKSERMILNNFNTIQFIRETIHQPLNPQRLTEIQKLMTDKTLENPLEEGRFRDNDEVRVIDAVDGEIMHQPPPVSALPLLIGDLCKFVNGDDEKLFIHPIIKASIVHFLIGFIHPFADGNGRTARALFYWYLLKKGYWLTEYLSISSIILKARIQYANAFLYTETDENDLTYFIQFKIKTLRLAYTSLLAYLERKLREKKAATQFLTIGGINDRQSLILQEISDEPKKVYRVIEIEKKFGVSNATARNDLRGLEVLGLLISFKVNKKEYAFSKSTGFEERIEQLKHTARP